MEVRYRLSRVRASATAIVLAAGLIAVAGCGGSAKAAEVVQVPTEYKSYFQVAAKRCPAVLTPQLLAAIAYTESRFQSDAESGGQAQGLMQILPSVFRQYGVDADGDGRKDVFTPADNVATSAVVLCMLSKSVTAAGDRLQGSSLDLLLASYNAGFGNVQKYKGVPPFTETQDYVRQVALWAERFTPQFAVTPSNQ
jgi:soluble lytic murein transglycosylase-like protein